MTQKRFEMEICFPEVSTIIIVVIYNQDLNRIIQTLDSIVIQEGVSFEIIVCDDGSNMRFEKNWISISIQRTFIFMCCFFMITTKELYPTIILD